MVQQVVRLVENVRQLCGDFLIADLTGLCFTGSGFIGGQLIHKAEVTDLILGFGCCLRDRLCCFSSFGRRGFCGGSGAIILGQILDVGNDLGRIGVGGLAANRCGGRRRLIQGRIVHAVALHIADQSLAHFQRRLPTILGLGRAGFQNDLCNFIIGIEGSGQHLFGSGAVKGKRTAVKCLVEDQTDGVDIHRGIQGGESILNFRSGVSTAIPVGKRSVLQRV